MTQIIAHRGASGECLENTLAAFARALDQGADGIELDVHATADGTIVVHHDATIRRAGDNGPIAIGGLSASDLSRVSLADGSPVPTLDQVFELVGDRLTVYVEVKAAGIEAPLLACLDRHPRARFAVHSFDHRIPDAIRRARPGTATGYLSASYPLDLSAMLPRDADALWQAGDLIDGALVQAAHAKGARVIAWTVNRPAHARALSLLGVDALCTDLPGSLRASLTG